MSLEAEGENWTTTKETETNIYIYIYFFFLLFWSQCSSYIAFSDILAFDFFCLVEDV